ncbi:hypothetical protein I6G97_00020 (plasmid) [Edwardsiella hoshinae]|uniref:Conjugal transfer protein TrbF n=1 Tax=Edwardsiella hoshinae TaxID=93378 RepID=A0A376IXW0_9GAMM|nr:hypothetical protein [Edwardsiella hoshinae]QPR26584.1 hypothetical protein I6G97_00020 [Edwardsiella hoshinae]STE53252.1 conjugal transfer protein TrbF [Edwardsiella hoshinae]
MRKINNQKILNKIEKIKLLRKRNAIFQEVFSNLALVFWIVGFLSYQISHEIFDVAFSINKLDLDGQMVKAIWNVAMYIVPGGLLLFAIAFTVVWIVYCIIALSFWIDLRRMSQELYGNIEGNTHD